MKYAVIILSFLICCGAQLSNANNLMIPADNFFSGPNVNDTIVKVKELNKYRDDSYLTLRGHITKRISADKFMFSDGSGEVIIEIDDKVMYTMSNAALTPKNLLEIEGELEKEMFEPIEIDVKKITILK